MNSSVEQRLKSHYSTVFALRFSPDGNHLAAADYFGDISVFKLHDYYGADGSDQKQHPPHLKFTASNSSLFTFESTQNLLLCAPLNSIHAYKWTDLAKSRASPEPALTFRLPELNQGSDTEINSLAHDAKSEEKSLYAGCGNGEIYCFDLEANKMLHKYTAHNESIYQVALKNNNTELVSASEDGSVKIWDLRTKDSVLSIRPYENIECSRPSLGKFVTCIGVDEDNNWLICGGGPRLAIWHLRSVKPMSVLEFEVENFVPNVCRIYDNQIISGGNKAKLFFHTFENKLKSEIRTSSEWIYDVTINKSLKTNRILGVSGSGNTIDICSNFAYKAFTLQI